MTHVYTSREDGPLIELEKRIKITHFADAYTLQRLSELEAEVALLTEQNKCFQTVNADLIKKMEMSCEGGKAFERWCKKENKQYRPTDDGASNRRDRLVWQAAQVEMKEDLDDANKWASHYAKRASELEDWKKQAEFGMACMAAAIQQSKRELEAEKSINAGWKLVPLVPTKDMLYVACVYLEDSDFVATGLYAAMLAASPTKEIKHES